MASPSLTISGQLNSSEKITNFSTGPNAIVRFNFTSTPIVSGSKSNNEDWPTLLVTTGVYGQQYISRIDDWSNPVININDSDWNSNGITGDDIEGYELFIDYNVGEYQFIIFGERSYQHVVNFTI